MKTIKKCWDRQVSNSGPCLMSLFKPTTYGKSPWGSCIGKPRINTPKKYCIILDTGRQVAGKFSSSDSLPYCSRFHRNALCDPLVCPSVYFHDNSRAIRRRMMKLGIYTLEVKSNIELEEGSGTWPLTRSNWRFSWYTFRVHVRLHRLHVHVPIPVEYLYV